MSRQEKTEKISITLPPDMLESIKHAVQQGNYASTSEVIRDAMRLWQKQEAKHQAELEAIRLRLHQSASSGKPVNVETAFTALETHHRNKQRSAH